MNAPPSLFDAPLRRWRRDRAAKSFRAGAYLHRAAAEGVAERLEPITRPFPDAAVFGAADGVFAEALLGRFGIARLRQFEVSPALAASAPAALGPIEIGAADASPLAPESMDLIVIGLELHAMNDPLGALIQARRALRPDGVLVVPMFAGETLSELRRCLADAEIEIADGLSPRVAPMADLRDLGGLLQRAGFAMPAADSDRFTVWQPSMLHLMRDIRAMGGASALTQRLKRPSRRALFFRAAALYQERHGRADGKVAATVEIAYLFGWAPAAAQPKPLRPGSATARLADALGSAERSAGEIAGAPGPGDKG